MSQKKKKKSMCVSFTFDHFPINLFQRAVAEERYKDAALLRDNAGAGLVFDLRNLFLIYLFLKRF